MTTTEIRPQSQTVVTPLGEPVRRTTPVPGSQLAIVIGVTLLTIADVPNWSSSTWVAKEAVLAVLAAAGLPILVALAIGRSAGIARSTRLAARFAFCFVVVALISALASAAPGLAMVGLYQQGTGWVFVAGLAGCWALGTRLGPKARELLQIFIICSAVANGVIALLQLVVGLNRFGLPLYNGGLADGLQGNPFELGALMAAGLALMEGRFRKNPWSWFGPVALVMIGAGASGERLPLILIAGVLAWSAWQVAGPRRVRAAKEIKRLVAFCAVTIGGVVIGSLIFSSENASQAFQRISTSTSQETFGQRFMAWREGLRAFAHHILIGAGPGQFRSVTSALFPFSFVKANSSNVFTDAHNFVIEYLTTTGILGAAALLAWLVVAIYKARGPLVVAALVLIAIELAEPLNVAVFPVALAALGAAGPLAMRTRHAVALRTGDQNGDPPRKNSDQQPDDDEQPALHRSVRALDVVMTVVGLVAGSAVLVGDGLMQRAQGQFGLALDGAALSNANTANILLAPWPDSAQAVSEIHFYLGLGDHPAQREQSVAWAKVAVSRDPTNPSLLIELASYEMNARQYKAAQSSAIRAWTYLPWFPSALNTIGVASLALGERAEAHHWFGLSLQVEPDQPSIENFYSGKCGLQLHQIGLSLLKLVCGRS